MEEFSDLKMNKTELSLGCLADSSDEKLYWLSKTPDERLEALELVRQVLYGYDTATAGFQ
jgi:hypothetical protein